MEYSEFKENVKSAMTGWVERKLDELSEQHPRVKAVSPYLNRGFRNWLSREDEKIDSALRGLQLFVGDESGNIDPDVFFDDAIALFKEMDQIERRVGPIAAMIGKGEILIEIPDNAFLNILFGDLGRIRLSAGDLAEIKDLIKNGGNAV